MNPFSKSPSGDDEPEIPATSGAFAHAGAQFSITPVPEWPPPPRRSLDDIRRMADDLHLASDGDGNERNFWPVINEQFPNYEILWRNVVVPTTRRIELPLGSERRHERRAGVTEDLWLIAYINYSVFLNIVGAFQHLAQPVMLSLGNFYTHLASACDLVEEFLLRVHLLICECRGEPVPEFANVLRLSFGIVADKEGGGTALQDRQRRCLRCGDFIVQADILMNDYGHFENARGSSR